MAAPWRLIGFGHAGTLAPTTHRRKQPPRPRVLASGVHGRIAWHRYTAGEIRGYLVERDPSGHTLLRAHVANGDEYKLSQGPLAFVITLERGSCRWPIEAVIEYRDHKFTARLGPAETRERMVG